MNIDKKKIGDVLIGTFFFQRSFQRTNRRTRFVRTTLCPGDTRIHDFFFIYQSRGPIILPNMATDVYSQQ